MGFIKNFDSLASTPERKVVLELIESALASIQPKVVMENHFVVTGNKLKIQDKTYNLNEHERIFLVGFGKGSAEVCRIIEQKLGDKLTAGWDIDIVDEAPFTKVKYTKGSHPLPSQVNIDFTKTVLDELKVADTDLVLVVICGGGSVLFEEPFAVELTTLQTAVKALLNSGATITEMNVIRKHLSLVKGGGLAKLLYPATVASIIFSDVPGNDLSVIASGPTVQDSTSIEDVHAILEKYQIKEKVTLSDADFREIKIDDNYFTKIDNILMVSNQTALQNMQAKATELGIESELYSDHIQGDAHTLGNELIEHAIPGKILLAGGESTIKITGNGQGGRNQALVLSSLWHIDADTIIAAFDSDGWDYYGFAGAIGDITTIAKAKQLTLNPKEYVDNDDSYNFLAKVEDGIDTGKLESNVSDLYIVYKKISEQNF